MCHSRTLNNKINKLDKWCLGIVFNDHKLSLKELLEIDKSVPKHIKNLQVLPTNRVSQVLQNSEAELGLLQRPR